MLALKIASSRALRWQPSAIPLTGRLGAAALPARALAAGDARSRTVLIRSMRPVVLLAAALPVLPLLLTRFPLDELVLTSVRSLVGM